MQRPGTQLIDEAADLLASRVSLETALARRREAVGTQRAEVVRSRSAAKAAAQPAIALYGASRVQALLQATEDGPAHAAIALTGAVARYKAALRPASCVP